MDFKLLHLRQSQHDMQLNEIFLTVIAFQSAQYFTEHEKKFEMSEKAGRLIGLLTFLIRLNSEKKVICNSEFVIYRRS